MESTPDPTPHDTAAKYIIPIGETKRVLMRELTPEEKANVDEQYHAIHRREDRLREMKKATASVFTEKIAEAVEAAKRLDAVWEAGEAKAHVDCIVELNSLGAGSIQVRAKDTGELVGEPRPLTPQEREKYLGLFKPDAEAYKGLPEMRPSAPPANAMHAALEVLSYDPRADVANAIQQAETEPEVDEQPVRKSKKKDADDAGDTTEKKPRRKKKADEEAPPSDVIEGPPAKKDPPADGTVEIGKDLAGGAIRVAPKTFFAFADQAATPGGIDVVRIEDGIVHVVRGDATADMPGAEFAGLIASGQIAAVEVVRDDDGKVTSFTAPAPAPPPGPTPVEQVLAAARAAGPEGISNFVNDLPPDEVREAQATLLERRALVELPNGRFVAYEHAEAAGVTPAAPPTNGAAPEPADGAAGSIEPPGQTERAAPAPAPAAPPRPAISADLRAEAKVELLEVVKGKPDGIVQVDVTAAFAERSGLEVGANLAAAFPEILAELVAEGTVKSADAPEGEDRGPLFWPASTATQPAYPAPPAKKKPKPKKT